MNRINTIGSSASLRLRLCRVSVALLGSVVAAAAAPVASNAQVNVVAQYRLGENDPGATIGGVGDTTTVAAVGTNLTEKSGTTAVYSSPLESNSTISLALNGGGYTTSAPVTTTTDNFGIEGFFMPTTTPTGNEILAYNGNTYLNGFGLLIRSSGEYSGIYGGVSFFDTGVQAVANTPVYFAMVRDNGVLSLYLDSNVAITPPSSTDTPFAASAASGVGFELGTDNISENFAGSLDEVRVFTFAPGAFNAAQDLEIDNAATAPEPPGASLILVCGLPAGAAVVVRKCWRRAS